MAEKYGAIYDAIVAKNKKNYEEGNVDAAVEYYGDNGVVVDKKNHKTYSGSTELKEMIAGWLKMGKTDFKITRKSITDVGGGRFYVDIDIDTKFLESGNEMKATCQSLFEKKGEQWICMYEGFEIL